MGCSLQPQGSSRPQASSFSNLPALRSSYASTFRVFLFHVTGLPDL